MARHFIFLPGTLLNAEQYESQLSAFRKHHEVRVFEYVRPVKNANSKDLLEIWTNDFCDYLQSFDGKAVICGHSLGGAIALQAALRVPQKFEKLVLAETHFSAKHGLMGRLQMPLAKTFLRTAEWSQIRSSMLRHHAKHSFESKIYLESLWHPRIPPMLFREQLLAAINYDGEQILRKISVPTQIIVGDGFERTQKQAEMMVEMIPNSTLHRLNGGGHLVNMDCARAFNAALEEGLALAQVA